MQEENLRQTLRHMDEDTITIEVDEEVTFRRGRVSLGEITNLSKIENVSGNEKIQASMNLSRNTNAYPLGCEDTSEDENDITVAIDMGTMSLKSITDRRNFPAYTPTAPKFVFTEADMTNALKKCKEEESQNLEEAVAIADKLLDRAGKADKARGEACAALDKSRQELKLAREELAAERQRQDSDADTKAALAKCQAELINTQEALLREKEESSMSQTQLRALAHSIHAIEMEAKAAIESHVAALASKDEAHTKDLHIAALKFEAERAHIAEEHAAALTAEGQKVSQLTEELRKQLELQEEAVTDAKQKVYAKVKAQFDNGNKEFNRIKGEKDAVVKDLEAAKLQIQAEQDRSAAAEERCTSSRAKLIRLGGQHAALLKEIIPSTQHARISKLYSEPALVDGSEKDAEAAQLVSDQAREFLSKRTKEVSEMQAAASSLNIEVENAKSALEERERAIHSLSGKFDELKEQYLLEQRDKQMLQEELRMLQRDTQISSQATQKEKDSLMLAVAKLSTSTTTLEMQLQEARAEKAELDSRNAGLRKMNEEMMSMLEKAHGM